MLDGDVMTYRVLLRAAGPRFLVLGFLARLPYSIGALATLALVASATGDLAVAGLAGGLQAVGNSAGGLASGALADRFGIRRVGVALAITGALALVGLVVATWIGTVWMLLVATIAGLAQVPTGSFARVWWARRVPSQLAGLAMSYEGAVDEFAFVAGPALAGGLALVSPLTPTVLSAVLVVGAALPFVVGVPAEPVGIEAAGAPLPWPPLALLTAGMVAMGAIFGSLQVGVTAAGGGGLVYALLGAGSIVAGLLSGRFAERVGLPLRAAALLAGTLLVASGALPLPVAVGLCGLAVAPYMIRLFVLVQRLAPRGRLATAVATISAGGPIGTAIGSAVAGLLAQQHGASAAFVVAPVAAACALAAAVTTSRERAPHA
jgi:predicted MFS family arabinose efflux permease